MPNPYQTPGSEVEPDSKYRTFSFDECLNGPWQATTSNFWLLAGSSLVLWVGMMVGVVVPILGWFFFLPAFSAGATRFYLNVLDGRADLGDLFSGFNDYWQNTGRMLIFLGFFMVLSGLAGAVQIVGSVTGDDALTWIGMGIQYPLGFFVLARFYLAPLFIVERGMPAMEAIAASWQSTAPQWLLFAALALVSQICQFLGLLACGVGIVISMPFGYLMFVSAYRQMVGAMPVPEPRRRTRSPVDS